ncbi:MAG: family 20 glycosylhydrolase [Rikenellaceae bacterium]
MKKKTYLLSLLSAAVLAVSCSPKLENKVYNEGINIIPVPLEVTQNDATQSFTLTSDTKVVVASPDFAAPANYFISKVKQSTGFNLSVVDAAPEANFISLVLNTRVAVGNEGYTLSSNANGVTIEARTPQGAFYGLQSLLQLLPAEIESTQKIDYIAWTVPAVEIRDEPRFKYRGLMLDVCRHFMPVEDLKKQIDVLAMFKINRLHWHLTEDQAWRIEIKKYPKLTELGSLRTEGDGQVYGPFFYTQEQIKEVVAYAAERYIDVIPEIELPGHALAALTAYPEFSCTGGPFKQPRIIWGVEEDVYCIGKEETFGFLEDIISEVVELFPSEYFHIGADECPKNRWKECPDCQARAKSLGLTVKTDEHGTKHSIEEQLQSYTVGRVEAFLATKGKKLIGWDEILEGGLTPTSTVMSWRGEEGGIAAAQNGNEVIMTPGPGGLYLDHLQGAAEVEQTSIGGYAPLEKTYSYEPVPAQLTEDQKKYIIGAQGNVWTEYMLSTPNMEYMIYPRVLAVSEFTWSDPSRKDFTSFVKRLDNAMVRLDMHGINYHIPMPEGTLTQNVVFTEESTEVEFNNTRNLVMVYTTDGSEPTAQSTLYTAPIKVSGKGEIKIATKLVSDKLSASRTVAYEQQTLAPAVTPEKSEMTAKLAEGQKAGAGARLRVAEGLYPTVDTYANARFGTDTIVSTLFEGKLWDLNKPSLGIFEGYITLPEDGVYTFTSDMDELWIDGVKIIENPKLSRHYKMKAQKALAAGKHSYKIVFNNMTKDGWPNSWSRIGFQFQTPSSEKWVEAHGEMLTTM